MWSQSLSNVINVPQSVNLVRERNGKPYKCGICVRNGIFRRQKRRVSIEMQPYVIIVDDSLATTATMPTAAVVPEGGGEDGYRTVLEIIARSMHRA